METWVEEIEDWDARSFSGGYAGLRDLADREFSGAVSSGTAWLFMVNGRVVGVVKRRQSATESEVAGAELDRFEDAEGTTYAAPAPSVPLLIAMKTADGETRAKYYTEDTPLREVHETLTDGGFTGFIELSENVLSGDYYVVYQGGKAMELAFIGNARRLLTDDDAFDRAADEVGIYEVTAVDLDVADVPEADGSAGAAADEAGADATAAGGAAAGAGAAGAGAAGAAKPDEGGEAGDDTGAGADGGAEPDAAEPGTDAGTGAAANAAGTDEANGAGTEGTHEAGTEAGTEEVEPGAPDPAADDAGPAGDEAEAETADGGVTAGAGTTDEGAGSTAEAGSAGSEPAPRNADAAGSETGTETQSHTDAGAGSGRSRSGDDRPAGDRSRPAEDATPGGAPTHQQDAGGGGSSGSPTDQLVDRTVPSLDPDRTGVGDAGGVSGAAGTGSGAASDRGAAPGSQRSGARGAGGQPELRDELAERERELEDARSALEDARDELEALREERDELQGTVEELRRRVDELESDVERARTAAREAGAATGEGPTLSAAEAFAGTNLFVRYDSKGELTLEGAHGGAGDPGELAANLALEHHTQFESEGASVGGRTFDSWLRSTQEFRFVRWLVTELLFEIRETGAADAMRDLYDALPEIDRVEIDAAVDVEAAEEEEEEEEEGGIEHREFDLVARDRMGQPLVVANLDDSRQPVSEGEMAELVEACTQVCHHQETLSGAFFVATSFFDPDALETARHATSDSLLSRDKRRSFVKLSRKRGFHLGLVEDRDSSFHLSIPDL